MIIITIVKIKIIAAIITKIIANIVVIIMMTINQNKKAINETIFRLVNLL